MPYACVVFGCSNRSNREKDRSFFRVPKPVLHKGDRVKDVTERRREKWLTNLSLLSKAAASPNARVCSDHFVKGCPSHIFDEGGEDWAPTLKLGYEKLKPKCEYCVEREKRTKPRPAKRRHSEGAQASLDLRKDIGLDDQEPPETDPKQGASSDKRDAECQTELKCAQIEALEEDMLRVNNELYSLSEKALDTSLTLEAFLKNDDKAKFYTGLPNALLLMQAFNLCEQYISINHMYALGKFEQFILVLMRLRLNLPVKDLAFRFKVSETTISRIWHEVINVLYTRLQFLIRWPEREILQATMPFHFRQAFGTKVAVILDCFEMFTERPSNLLARAQTWSNYNNHNTVKFLIGIVPQGLVTFISSVWGGRTSDKKITEDSGLLQNLSPGDIVLADREFNSEDSEGFYCASLKIPAFTKGKSQLSPCEVEQTRKMASVRIHVEQVIGLVRRKYQVLQSSAMPIEYMVKKPGDSVALIDKIAIICCALTNLSESVVPLE